MRFSVYRYNPETDTEPYMQDFQVDGIAPDMMVLDARAYCTDRLTSMTLGNCSILDNT